MCFTDEPKLSPAFTESAAVGREGEKDLLLFLKSITQHPPTGEGLRSDHTVRLLLISEFNTNLLCVIRSRALGEVTPSGLCRDLQVRHQRQRNLHHPARPARASTGGISDTLTLLNTQTDPPPCSPSFRDVYAICGSAKSRLCNIKVFVMAQAKCDMETAGGGWTVIQNRHDGSLNFNRTWQEYREGFGSPQGEHWLGNAALHALTSSGQHQLRIELEDWHQQRRQATYNNFKVASEAQR